MTKEEAMDRHIARSLDRYLTTPPEEPEEEFEPDEDIEKEDDYEEGDNE